MTPMNTDLLKTLPSSHVIPTEHEREAARILKARRAVLVSKLARIFLRTISHAIQLIERKEHKVATDH